MLLLLYYCKESLFTSFYSPSQLSSLTLSTTLTCIIFLLQQKGVADFHKNCFLSPVKSNDAIVKNFFFLNWYAQGEYVELKKILGWLLKFGKI